MLPFIVLSIVLKFISICTAGDLPSYFPRCNIDDPKLNTCILKATEEVRDYLRKGIPELDIPPMDPLIVPQITAQQGSDAVNYKLTLTNATIQGMSDYVFKDFMYTPKTLEFHGTATFEAIGLLSNYEIEGKILVAPIKGKGVVKVLLGPSSGSLYVKGELVNRNGNEHYNPVEVKATIEISNSTVTFDGLFNGNKELSRATNQLINEHSSELITEVLPAIEKVAEELFTKLMVGITEIVPYKKLLPPSN